MSLLQSKAVIITGASSGIGLAAARLFAQEGAMLVLVARDAKRLETRTQEIRASGGRAIACPGDVTQEGTHRAAIVAAQSEYGRLDCAFNNAGTLGAMRPLADLSAEEWHESIAANLTSAFLAARTQIPAMLKHEGGTLIFTGSFVGNSVSLPGMGAYAAAKAGLSGLVKSIAADYSHLGIRANALLPGGTDTEMAGSAQNKEWAATLHPMRRIARPQEIAQAALFLASEMSSFVNGSNLWADGGNAATKVQAPG